MAFHVNQTKLWILKPITMTERSKARNVFVHWTLGLRVRIPLRHACMSAIFLFVLSCAGNGIATGWSPVQRVLPTVYKIHSSRLTMNGNRPKGLIRQGRRRTGTLELLRQSYEEGKHVIHTGKEDVFAWLDGRPREDPRKREDRSNTEIGFRELEWKTMKQKEIQYFGGETV
jgi:hypothetical protein